jgi:hypothetical protein
MIYRCCTCLEEVISDVDIPSEYYHINCKYIRHLDDAMSSSDRFGTTYAEAGAFTYLLSYFNKPCRGPKYASGIFNSNQHLPGPYYR